MIQKYKITVCPEELTADFPEGATLLDAFDSMGIPIASPCGGKGICGQCLVEITGRISSFSPNGISTPINVKQEKHLACRTVLMGDNEINLAGSQEAQKIFVSAETKNIGLPHASFAVDIGTTTIEISLLDIKSEKKLASASFMNPLRRYGYDVISIIAAAHDTNVLKKMTTSLRGAIARYIKILIKQSGIPAENIKQIVISANTTMSYIFAGLELSPLGSYPYTPSVREFDMINANDEGLDLQHDIPILLLPVISAYIGGDIAGALALIEKKYADKNLFFVDLGTNGEMFLKARGKKTFALSCAMGPALEGMNISMGMTTAPGAVTHVSLKDNALDLTVQNNDGIAKGFAGSGIIDMIAIMLQSGIIRKDGAFNKKTQTSFSNASFRDLGLQLSNGLVIEQRDIRAIQLAKSACRCGAEILFQEANFNTEDVELVIIAGALGSSLNTISFGELDFLPVFVEAQNLLSGNTSLAAAEQCCFDSNFFAKIISMRNEVQVIDAAEYPNFNDLFIKYLNFE